MRMQRSGFNDGNKSVHDRKVLIVLHDVSSLSVHKAEWLEI